MRSHRDLGENHSLRDSESQDDLFILVNILTTTSPTVQTLGISSGRPIFNSRSSTTKRGFRIKEEKKPSLFWQNENLGRLTHLFRVGLIIPIIGNNLQWTNIHN